MIECECWPVALAPLASIPAFIILAISAKIKPEWFKDWD